MTRIADCRLSSRAPTQRAIVVAGLSCSVLVACSEQPEAPPPTRARVGLALQLVNPTDPSLGGCALGSASSFSIGIPPPSSASDQGTPVTSGDDDVSVRCRVTPDAATPGVYSVTAEVYSPLIVFELSGSTSESSATGSLHVVAATAARDLSTETCSLGATPEPFAAAPGKVWGSLECANAVAKDPGVACNVFGLLLLSGCSP